MRPATRLALVLAGSLALGLACSTVKRDREYSCNVDADCEADELCQSGECYRNTLAVPAQVGIDVSFESNEGDFRVELKGSDRLVERVVDEPPARFRVRLSNGPKPSDDDEPRDPGVRDRLELAVTERYELAGDLKIDRLAATLVLEQSSRLRREPLRSEGTYTPLGPDDADTALVLQWPRYDPKDSDEPLLLGIRPGATTVNNETVERGPIHRQLVRVEQGLASTQEFPNITTHQDCHRKLVGNVVVGDNAALPARVSVELLHTHSPPDDGKSVCDPTTDVQAVCEPSTIHPNELPPCTSATDCPEPYGCYPTGDSKRCGCNSDDECRTGQICELGSHRCALDLIGKPATLGAVPTEEGKSTFDAWVYTYCDDDLEVDREMSFVLRSSSVGLDDGDMTTPLPASPLPALSFDVTVDIPASTDNTIKLPGNLCFPEWDPPRELTLDITSKPREVFRDDMDRPWVCCTTECLGMMLTEPPPAPATCPVAGALTARTLYTPDPALALANNCLPLTRLDSAAEPGSQWVLGGKTTLGNCVGQGGNPAACTISLSPGDLFREYELRLEPPVGSLVRSTSYAAVVGQDNPSLPAPPIEYRVLLRGTVALEAIQDAAGAEDEPTVCANLTNCSAQAEILAERIRLPGDDATTVLGPYFYTTRTIEGSGEFVLPVNPGVYLVTALPAISTPGGPAKIAVLDLRLDSSLVDTSGEIPTATLKDPLLLVQNGQFVIFELAGFDFASVATPFDLGSWSGLRFGGRELDLNDPRTCYGDPGRGCSIRRLRAGNSGLALTQEEFVKFIARAAPAD